MRSATRVMAGLLMAATVMIGGARAAEYEVRMLDRGEAGMMVFEPSTLRIAPGDSVRFRATQPGHSAESIPSMTPEGAPLFKGRLNEEITVTFDRPGIYGYQCKPHYAMGMVGVIMVGEGEAARANLEAARGVSHPPRARARFQRMFQGLAD
ncbi:pseudoazurin [Roseomonas rosea]|uniref:Pseudoazurin n=1 Tax=Muricoccus roseus TaxID=198092 RepID=A0A1M6QCE1_9PROT|nr:pseudoazurin [Roseomonas rosea]SHK17912.1 pseudoazurin [Roseomonas rosea]